MDEHEIASMVRGYDPSPVHDDVTLTAATRLYEILEHAETQGWIGPQSWTAGTFREVYRAEPEFRIRKLHENGYIDLAIVKHDVPLLFLEIKSKREPQSASAWLRQVRSYEATGTPCVLVVAHDLDEVMLRYFAWTKVRVIDLRTL